jgi:peptidoglycan/LPS O-acetylase OafA/YrhL
VRAFAILGVMAYHLGLGWASGGYLGVDLFFVLSGFLITSLLLEEHCVSGGIRLGAFWGRRARRLLPALFLLLVAVALYAVVNGRFSSPGAGGAAIDLNGLRGDALATLLYVANWHAIFSHQSYFAQFSTPSPLQHTWSLAIEEQFYLVWPLALFGLLRWSPKHWRKAGFIVCILGAVASAVAMAVLYHPGGDPSRIYYGTDTRAFDLLAGATVAFLAAGRPQPRARVRSWLHVASLPAVVALMVFWVVAGTKSEIPRSGMFLGGFLVCALLAAVVIADVRQLDQGPLARLLSLRPLRWIGMISYGLYLWHWPIYVYLNQARTGLSGAALDAARIALTFAVATASYYVLELPVRRGRFAGFTPRVVLPSGAVLTVLIVLAGTTTSIAEPALAAPVRVWVGGLDPGRGANVVGAGGFGSEVPIALPPGLVIDSTHRLRVLAFGDSIMTLAENGLQAALGSTRDATVVPGAVPGWVLDPSDMSSLMKNVRRWHPQVLVGTWSWDSANAKNDPAGYQATLDAAVRRMLSPGDGVLGVVFLQMPALGPVPGYLAYTPSEEQSAEERVAGVPAWNAAVQEAAQRFPGKVMYLPVASSLELDGGYTNWLPPHGVASAPRGHWVRVRTTDDVHLCPAGISRYAAPILQDLTTIFHLTPSSVPWWREARISQNFYESAQSIAESCPDDHPPKSLGT